MSISNESNVNPTLFGLTKSILNFILPNNRLNLKEQIQLHNVFFKEYPLVAFVGFCLGELGAIGAKRRFAGKLDLFARPHRIYLLYTGCGIGGALMTLPTLGYLMTFALMRLDVTESPQSAILHAQKEEIERLNELKKLGASKERVEYDWEDKEKKYLSVAEEVRKENLKNKNEQL